MEMHLIAIEETVVDEFLIEVNDRVEAVDIDP